VDVVSGSFVWDDTKEAANVIKHGVDFVTAAEVFADTKKKIFKDPCHSLAEARLFCIGKVGEEILTVRFTYGKCMIRIIGAGYWRKGRKYYEEA